MEQCFKSAEKHIDNNADIREYNVEVINLTNQLCGSVAVPVEPLSTQQSATSPTSGTSATTTAASLGTTSQVPTSSASRERNAAGKLVIRLIIAMCTMAIALVL